MQTLHPRLFYHRKVFGSSFFFPVAIAGLLLLFHIIFNLADSYGIFRDEFYYLACAKRPAWGYVDQPPLSVFLLILQTELLGDSLAALRVLPALALSGTVICTGLMVQRLRGGVMAVVLACVAVAMAPIYLAMGSYYSMNSIDIFLWSATALLIMRICRKPSPDLWILLGFILGIGLLNKVGFLWLGAGLLTGILLTGLRRHLLTPWPYVAATIAFLIFMPFIIWNFYHDFAHLEFMQNAIAFKYKGISRADFISGMVVQLNPVALLIWLPGLYFFLWSEAGRKYRVLGILFLTVFLILLINGHSKPEYIAPAFSFLLAGGAVFLEKEFSRKGWSGVLAGFLALLVISGLILAPIVKPVLPVETFIRYSDFIGFSNKSNEGKEVKELPPFYADRFGWEELAAKASSVYLSLPADEQESALIYTQNYGEAGALEYYQQKFPLPPVLSGHNAYWHWGNGMELHTLIAIGGSEEDYKEDFEEVNQVATHHSRYAMPYESNLPVFVCRKPKSTFQEQWPGAKHYE